jgi:hypothetical protein
MKHILDPSFRYEPSFDTDVRRTFERVRKQQQAQARGQAKADPEGRLEVLQLDPLWTGRTISSPAGFTGFST